MISAFCSDLLTINVLIYQASDVTFPRNAFEIVLLPAWKERDNCFVIQNPQPELIYHEDFRSVKVGSGRNVLLEIITDRVSSSQRDV